MDLLSLGNAPPVATAVLGDDLARKYNGVENRSTEKTEASLESYRRLFGIGWFVGFPDYWRVDRFSTNPRMVRAVL